MTEQRLKRLHHFIFKYLNCVCVIDINPSLLQQVTILRIFQRFRLVKFIKKFKTFVKNLNIEDIVAFDKYLQELFFAIYFHLSRNFLRWKVRKLLIWLTFVQSAAVFEVFKNFETVDCLQSCLNCFWNSNLHWSFFRSSSNLNQTLSIIIQQF